VAHFAAGLGANLREGVNGKECSAGGEAGRAPFQGLENMEVQEREPNVHQGAANQAVRQTLQSLHLGSWPINLLPPPCHQEISQVSPELGPIFFTRLVGGRSNSMFPLCKLI
jgi:hypothetical protein